MPETYIISYPRSGNTALRYIIELLTDQPTNGLCGEPNPRDLLQKPLVHKGRKDYIAHKRHDFKDVTPHDFIIFIIRDYKEAIIRHNEHRGLDQKKLLAHVEGYCKLLNQFHEHEGGKLLVRYENLMKVAMPDSRAMYPNPQSRSDHHHKAKVGANVCKAMDAYVQERFPELWEQYLYTYETMGDH